MPATYAALRSAFTETAAAVPDLAPVSMIDVGGGTGAALWAATDIWPSLRDLTVIEQSAAAVELGRELLGAASDPVLRRTRWHRGTIDLSSPSPSGDVVTLSYVLGELAPDRRGDVVDWLSARTRLLVIMEPGTPAGYDRIAQARQRLTTKGHQVVAPCPHQRPCPISPGDDWCHFTARLPRLDTHRAVKEAVLNFEDEKFSYLAVTTGPVSVCGDRVLRNPTKRKGLVSLRVCTQEGVLADQVVTKRQGPRYRAARDVTWGQLWPNDGPCSPNPTEH
jgi:ribosomal protein RSM22 (predicted rRNA methylase)